MNSPHVISGLVSCFFRILGSTVVGKYSTVLEGLEGTVGGADEDDPGEHMTDAEAYGALGLVVRPRVPEDIDGQTLSAEGVGFRTPAGIVPLARRDLRLNRRFPSPKPGTVALVGYGGAFLSFDDADGDTTLATLKVPYARVNGTATKELSIVIDPESETITITAPTINLNGVTIDADGNLEAPGEVKAMSVGPGVRLSTHVHPTAMGPTSAPTPGT